MGCLGGREEGIWLLELRIEVVLGLLARMMYCGVKWLLWWMMVLLLVLLLLLLLLYLLLLLHLLLMLLLLLQTLMFVYHVAILGEGVGGRKLVATLGENEKGGHC